jgi:molecular chaperone IbpA
MEDFDMRTNFDFTPFRRSTVGFDRLFDLLENGTSPSVADNFPPFDIEQDGEDRYRITLAVAGFTQQEIDITSKQNLLVVTGAKSEDKERSYIHRGIAARAFERRFVLGDYVQVKGAELKDGLLTIELAREIPDEMKPRKIEIGSFGGTAISDQSAGNDNSHGERRAA